MSRPASQIHSSGDVTSAGDTYTQENTPHVYMLNLSTVNKHNIHKYSSLISTRIPAKESVIMIYIEIGINIKAKTK